MWHMDEVVQAVNGVVFRIEHENFSGISTDSRTIANGELFIPISGVTFDGHKFIADAYDKSHGGTLCEN
ncbi:MAG: murF [Deltaproteobacteria bacterium]|nr:murF [Deltaproteobacteria bacterium]